MRLVSSAQDVFNESTVEPEAVDPNDYYEYSFENLGDGIVRGTINVTGNLTLASTIQNISFQVRLVAEIPDQDPRKPNVFEFLSEGINISLENPFSMELFNRDGREVEIDCPADVQCVFFGTEVANELGEDDVGTDGAYIRSNNPYVARAIISFRGEPIIGQSNALVAVYDASFDACPSDGAPSPLLRRAQSTTVLAPATSLPIIQGEVQESGGEDAETKIISFVDIPLTVPRFPEQSVLYVQASYNGYSNTLVHPITFGTILQVGLNIRSPVADGIDIAEQRATAYILDPDFPKVVSKRTPVPDNQVMRWELIPRKPNVPIQSTRPFYSIDNVPLSDGVYSFVRNGSARNILFGPATGAREYPDPDCEMDGIQAVTFETFEIRATIQNDGLTTSKSENLSIFPPGVSTGSPEANAGILFEMPRFKNKYFSDGSDYVRGVLVRDANDPPEDSRRADCFLSCVDSVTPLEVGQNVTITAGENVEIIWGDVTETTNPDTGKKELIFRRELLQFHTNFSG